MADTQFPASGGQEHQTDGLPEKCFSCWAPDAKYKAGTEMLCERCARRDHAHKSGEVHATLGIIAVAFQSLRHAGMTDEEIIAAVHAELTATPHPEVPDIVGMPQRIAWFEDDVKRLGEALS